MTLQTYMDLEQRTDAWFTARCGVVTASAVKALVTPKTVKVAKNDECRSLAALLAAERITGQVDSGYVNADMWRGIESEPYAVEKYAEYHRTPVTPCGFMARDDWGFTIGYSPDGLVGDDGLIEVKSPRKKGHLLTVLGGEVPIEHMAQIQTGLLVSGRKWCDFISFHGGMHMWTKRVLPDGEWAAAILAAVHHFEETVAQMVSDYEAAIAGLPMTEPLPDPFDVELKL